MRRSNLRTHFEILTAEEVNGQPEKAIVQIEQGSDGMYIVEVEDDAD